MQILRQGVVTYFDNIAEGYHQKRSGKYEQIPLTIIINTTKTDFQPNFCWITGTST